MFAYNICSNMPIGVLTLPSLRVKCGGGIFFSTKNMPLFMPKMSSKPGITIMNKLFGHSKKPNYVLKK